MTRRVLVIGIGAGDPDHLTVQAIDALNRVDVFFVLDKGAAKRKLAALRHEILRRHAGSRPHRVVEAPIPERDTGAADYEAAVSDLNGRKRRLFARLIEAELAPGGCGAFLVWGDPSLYDSTIRILHEVEAAGDPAIVFEVIPGITSLQALAARHRTTLNQVGQPFQVTTGRRLADGFPAGVPSAAVMLDAGTAFRQLDGQADDDTQIFWGAYVGTPDEILVAGPLREVADRIARLRAEARAAHGWIMDSYILHRAPRAAEDRAPAGGRGAVDGEE